MLSLEQAITDVGVLDHVVQPVHNIHNESDNFQRPINQRTCCVSQALPTSANYRRIQTYRRKRFYSLQRQQLDVVKRHEELVKGLPHWIREHRRLLDRANRDKANMLVYVNLLTNRLNKDIDQLKTIQEEAMVLRCLQARSN